MSDTSTQTQRKFGGLQWFALACVILMWLCLLVTVITGTVTWWLVIMAVTVTVAVAVILSRRRTG